MKNLYMLPFIAIMLFSNITIAQENEDLYNLDLESLMNIEIVSASKKAENIFDAPLGASVLSAAQIKESGATSIMEALRLIPGLIVRETTPGNYDIHLRGYDGIDPNGLINLTANTITLIMVNNRPIYSEFSGQTYWELLQIGINDIDRIEVVRGPVSAMYGPNAVSGVINILTRSPINKKGLSASTYSMGGSPKTITTSTAVGYDFGNGLGVRISGNADFRDRHNVDYFIYSQNKFVDKIDNSILNTIGLPNVDPDHPYLGVQVGPNGVVPIPNFNNDKRYPDPSLAVNRYASNIQLQYKKNDLDVNLMGGYSNAKVQRVYANNNISSLTEDSLSNLFTHLWASYKNINASIDFTKGNNSILGSGDILSVKYDNLNANLEYNYNISDNLILKPGFSYKTSRYYSLGLGSEEQNMNPATFFTNGYEKSTPQDGGYVSNSVISGSLQADFHINKFRVVGALRVDKFSYPNKAIVSPLISTTYKVTDNFLIRGSYGRSSRTPFIFDLYADVNLRYPTGDTSALGNSVYHNIKYRGSEKVLEIPGANKSDYKLLTVDDVEVGFRHKISDSFTLDIELFWSQLQNIVTFTKVSTDTISGVDPLSGANTQEIRDYFSVTNLNAKPKQMGVTISLTSVPFPNTSFQIYAMMQQTKMFDYPDAIDVNGNEIDTDNDGYTNHDYYHMATPDFFGGINMNYKPTKKLNFNINTYIYSHQELTVNGVNSNEVDGNIILNATVNYKIKDDINIFATGRNLVGGEKRQYAFADKIGATILAGVNIKF